MNHGRARRTHILIVEDNAGDQRLIREAFRETELAPETAVAKDGVEALNYLFQRGAYVGVARPDLILLDLNLPRKDGREVLAEIKSDPNLRHIPVVVFSSSSAPGDVSRAYALHANCYVTKPADLDELFQAIAWIERFWFNTAVLPKAGSTSTIETDTSLASGVAGQGSYTRRG